MAFGNNEYNQCGIEGYTNISDPQEFIFEKKLKQIEMGSDFTIIVTGKKKKKKNKNFFL
jgi:hypothetical protein